MTRRIKGVSLLRLRPCLVKSSPFGGEVDDCKKCTVRVVPRGHPCTRFWYDGHVAVEELVLMRSLVKIFGLLLSTTSKVKSKQSEIRRVVKIFVLLSPCRVRRDPDPYFEIWSIIVSKFLVNIGDRGPKDITMYLLEAPNDRLGDSDGRVSTHV